MVFRERTLINSMSSMAPNIVFAPNITQNAEHRHWTQDTNTAHFRSYLKAVQHAKKFTCIISTAAKVSLFIKGPKLSECVMVLTDHFL